MSSNLPLVRRSCRVLPFLLNFLCMAKGCKLEINIHVPSQQIYANSKGGGLIIERGQNVK